MTAPGAAGGGGARRALVLLAAGALALAGGALLVSRSPTFPLLPGGGPASWIVYPRPGDTWPRRMVELPGRFARSFSLDAVPRSASLRLRAFRSARVEVNGRPVALPEAAHWKAERGADLAPLLRPGPNRIEAEVSNALGPPALWLALDLGGATLASDASWEASWAGATPRPAALASEPLRSDRADPLGLAPSPLEALGRHAPLLLGLAALSAAIALTASLAQRHGPAWLEGERGAAAVAAAAGLLWALLFWNNAPALPLDAGFDAQGHIAYVRHLLERRAIPLADEGWQMFQPPLYYLVVAAALSTAGLGVADEGAVAVVRGLGLAIGLAHLLLVAAGLRLLFPGEARRQALGFLTCAFLPPMLSMHQFIGNEPLVGLLGSGAVLATLLALRAPPRPASAALLGLLLGLALLAKLSALLLLPACLGALAWRALADAPGRRARLAGLATTGAVLLATCGWYFARVWARFGTPFVGGWDPSRGYAWWQDPGYRTPGDFLRVGRVFARPFYAGFHGFWDGLYATLWSDGLLAGRGEIQMIPHWWSISLLSAGVLLALPPCLAVVGGLGRAVAGWVRRPSAEMGLLAALALAVLAALALMTIQVPSVVSDKASYGLLALLPFGCLAALGLDAVAGRGRAAAILVAAALGTWGLAAWAAHWVERDAPGTRAIRANDLIARGQALEGARTYAEILRRDPGEWGARLSLAEMMLDGGAPAPEVARTLRGGPRPPENEWRHHLLARLAEREGNAEEALREAQRAVSLDPDQPDARALLAALLERRGATPEAEAAWREVLRVNPQRQDAHRALALLGERRGDGEGAARHLEWARRLEAARRADRGSAR